MSDETLQTDAKATDGQSPEIGDASPSGSPAKAEAAAGATPDPDNPAPQAAAPADAEVIAAKPEDEVGLPVDESDEDSDAEAVEAESAESKAASDADLEAAEAAMDDDEEPAVVSSTGPIEELSDEEMAEEIILDWYILKVQSNRERTSSEALKRKVAIEGIDHLFGDIIVPTEKVTEFKNGKKKTVERKIWPGYIAVRMHVNDDTWFAIRETAGIGDFTGASGKPIPMSPADVEKILPKEESEEGGEDNVPKLNIKFIEGDKVKVTDGNFENFEGDVDSIDHQSGKVSVMISIFGRSTPVELEYWQIEKL